MRSTEIHEHIFARIVFIFNPAFPRKNLEIIGQHKTYANLSLYLVTGFFLTNFSVNDNPLQFREISSTEN